MTVRSYLWGMRLSTLVALIGLGLVIDYVDPTRSGVLGQTLFYISMFFSVTGLAALFLFWLRRRFLRNEIILGDMGISYREGLLIASVVSAMFVLQSFRLLVWWDAGLVIAAVLLIELWFLSK